MTETIPPWQFSAHCPQCNAVLGIKRDTESGAIEVKADDRLFCPVHGDVMSLEEARQIAFEDNRDDIIDKARKFSRDRLKDALKRRR